MNKIIAIIVLLIVLGIGVFAFTRPTHAPKDQMVEVSEEMMDNTQAKGMESESSPVSKEISAGSYEPYSVEKLALAENGKVVLFFRAPWCPTCRALDSNIKSNLNSIPENVTILDVDYDSSTALRQKYMVTYQHTLVQVDARGEIIKKWSGSLTLSAILAALN